MVVFIFMSKEGILCEACLKEGKKVLSKAKGLCNKHYLRKWKYGDVNTVIDGRTKHGLSCTKTFALYYNMKQRCFNSNNDKYPDYGGRGITVCESWVDSISNFHKDMGDCPEGYSIERIDVNGNYEPSNCIWADDTTQSRNKRKYKNRFSS